MRWERYTGSDWDITISVRRRRSSALPLTSIESAGVTLTRGKAPIWEEMRSYSLPLRLSDFPFPLTIPTATRSSVPASDVKSPFIASISAPCLISALSGIDDIALARHIMCMASSILLLPIPLSPTRQLTPGEKSRRASGMFLKSSISMRLSTMI